MRTLYLHVGFHKTGSSSLQLSLYNTQEKLRLYNWEFFSLDSLGNSSSFIQVEKNNGISSTIKDSFFECMKTTSKDNVIVSGEHFSFLNKKEELIKLKNGLQNEFDNVKVVIYLRRQDKLALSFKQQAAKGNRKGYMASSLLCGHSENALPALTEDIKEYLNFNQKVRLWSACFGKNSILVRLFEPSRLIGGDICHDFSEAINLPFRLNSLRVNEGINRLFSLYSHLLINFNADPNLIDKVRSQICNDKDKVLPSEQAASEFYKFFKYENNSLFEWLKFESGFDDDFSSYPTISNYKLTMEENAFLIENMALFSKTIDKIVPREIDMLRDTALYLESIDVNKAYNVMLLAKKLRPEGKLINKKLSIYRTELS